MFTPDGETLVTPTSDGSGILLWDTDTRKQVGVLDHEDDMLLDAAVSPDGRWLVAAAYWQEGDDEFGNGLQVWDLPGRKLVQRIEGPVGATSTAFSADGRTLVTQGGPLGDPPALTAQVWDTATWDPIGEPWLLADEYVGDQVIAVSADGRLLAAPMPEGAIDVWRVADRTLVGHAFVPTSDERKTAMAFSPNGDTLAIAGELGGIALVDPATGEPRGPALTVPDAAPSSMEFSPDGAMLGVSTAQGRTQLFDVASGQPLGPSLAANASSINDVSFSPDGSQLATAGLDRTGAIWRLDGQRSIGAPFPDHTAVVTEVHVTPDGTALVAGSADGTVTIRDLARGTVRTVQIGGEVLTVALDDTGTTMAVAGTLGRVQLFDVATGAPGPQLTIEGAWIHQVAFQPNTGVLAIGVESNPGVEPPIGAEAGYAMTWDPATGEEVGRRIIEGRGGFPEALAWNADGSLLVLADASHVLRFYDGQPSHRRLGEDIDSEDAAFLSVAVSPDGSRVATGTSSGIVRQWSVATHRELGAALTGHTGWVTGVAYSPDGSMLASTTTGFSTTRLWDVATGASIGNELTAGRTPFTDRTFVTEHIQGSRPAFTPDGRSLATPSWDGTVVVWDLDPVHWLDAACRVVGRDLTEDEWDRYFDTRAYRHTCAPDVTTPTSPSGTVAYAPIG